MESTHVLRFAPEPSGYLHLGHAKAIFFNQQLAKHGRLLLRFDDTNPENESKEFEEAILDDLKMLGVHVDQITHTSDYQKQLCEYAERLIQSNQAYVDSSTQDEISAQRRDGTESRARSHSEMANSQRWYSMVKGNSDRMVLRARMDMQSPNKAMRDPVLFRIQDGKLCPTYDFACAVVDALEGVTMALRDTNYRDRRDQYHRIQQMLGLKKVRVREFGRLGFKGINLSKRYMKELVKKQKVDGWDDPRLPTLRGWMRRGLSMNALRKFVLTQGWTQNVNMELDILWSLNKKEIDKNAARVSMVRQSGCWSGDVEAESYASREVPTHPKHPEGPFRTVQCGAGILFNGEDAQGLQKGDLVMLMNWGKARVTDIYPKTRYVKFDLVPEEKEKAQVFIHWVLRNNYIPATVLDYKGLEVSETEYLAEPYTASVALGHYVQIFRDKGRYCIWDQDNVWIRVPNGKGIRVEDFAI